MPLDGVRPSVFVKAYGGSPPPFDQPGLMALLKSKAVVGCDGGGEGGEGGDGGGGGEGGGEGSVGSEGGEGSEGDGGGDWQAQMGFALPWGAPVAWVLK